MINITCIAGYQTAYSQLAFAGKKEQDLLSESVPELKMSLAKHLEKLNAAQPGKVSTTFIYMFYLCYIVIYYRTIVFLILYLTLRWPSG